MSNALLPRLATMLARLEKLQAIFDDVEDYVTDEDAQLLHEVILDLKQLIDLTLRTTPA